MALLETLDEVKSYIGKLKRKYRFRKAQAKRDAEVELQMTLGRCRGKLEICRKDLIRAANEQCRNIQEGEENGNDTVIQEQVLWDAAIGYMLVQDAIYALETINSYDSIAHAYEILDAAMKQVAGKKSGFPNNMKVGPTKERNAYGYITSHAALREKETLLEGIFEKLKAEGDIEAQVDALNKSKKKKSSQDEGNSLKDYKARLDSHKARQEEDFDLSDLQSIRPPDDNI